LDRVRNVEDVGKLVQMDADAMRPEIVGDAQSHG
jgi:hypothetical protein